MKAPSIFIGHGSPMNAIEHNSYTDKWEELGKQIHPKAILMLSAHWFTRGTFVQDEETPKIINDMYGFPKELYNVNYQVKGSLELTNKVIKSVDKPVIINNQWGIDHGSWSVLNHMYPNRDIPIVQLSIDLSASEEDHYHIGNQLSTLRDDGILIIGSGNIVHNLRKANFEMVGGYDWSDAFDQKIKSLVLSKSHDQILDYKNLGTIASLSVPTTDHFDPLLYILGTTTKDDHIEVFNESSEFGSLSMTSYLFTN